jgi:hypothetical protein
MKPPSQRVAIIYLVLVAAILVLIGLKLTIWSAPGIVIFAERNEVVIDSRFLGEYHLGLERILISTESGQEAIVDLRDAGGKLPNIFRVGGGVNRIKLPGGEPTTFVLDPGKPYVLMLCGNNGWGRTTCRSKSLRVPAG